MAQIVPLGSGLAQARPSFWTEILGVDAADEAMLSAALSGAAQISYDQLCSLLSLSLAAAPVLQRRIMPVVQLFQFQGSVGYSSTGELGWTYPVSPELRSAPFLLNAPANASLVLQSGLDYELVHRAGKTVLWLRDYPHTHSAMWTSPTVVPAQTLSAGAIARVESGVLDDDLTDPDSGLPGYLSDLQSRDLTRRTVTLDRVIDRVTLTVRLGQVVAAAARDAVVPQSRWEGLGLVIADPVRRELRVLSVAASGAMRLSGGILQDGVVEALLVDDNILTTSRVGDTLWLDRPGDEDNTRSTTIVSVLTGRSCVVDSPTRFTGQDAAATELSFGWRIETSPMQQVTTLYAPDSVWDAGHLQEVWGDLLGLTGAPSTRYKQVLMAAAAVYLRGATVAGVTALANLALGFPVISSNQETHLTTKRSADADVLTTTAGVYTLPAGTLREDLWAVAERPYEFTALEALTDVAAVRDQTTDPTWFYGQSVPREVADDVRARVANVQVSPFTLGTERLCGDPGVYIGADYDGNPLTDVVRDYDSGFLNGDRTQLTLYGARLYPTQANCTVILDGARLRASTVNLSTRVVTLRQAAASASVRQYTATAATSNDITITLGPADRPLTAQDQGLLAKWGSNVVRIVRVRSAYRCTVEGYDPVGYICLGTETFTVGIRATLVERGPLALPVGAFLMSWAAGNIAQLVWRRSHVQEAQALISQLASVLNHARPAHALLSVSSAGSLYDAGALLEAALLAGLYLTNHAVYGLCAYPTIGGQWDQWSLGQAHMLGQWALSWETRVSNTQITTAPATADDAQVNTSTADQVAVRLSSRSSWTSAAVTMWLWDDESWVNSGHTVVVSDVDPIAWFPSLGGQTAFTVAGLPSDSAAYIGLRRETAQTTVQCDMVPRTCEVTQGDAAVVFSDVVWQPFDVGTILALTYPGDASDGWIETTDEVYIETVVDATDAELASMDGTAYAGRRTDAAAQWVVIGHRRHGQVPRRLHDQIDATQLPAGEQSRQAWITDVPVTYEVS
jgi:hypothetical protein